MNLLLEFSFLDVVWWMIIIFFWTMVFWMFISIFADIFRRRDLSGWGKVGWTLLIVFLPLLGILIYIIARPPMATAELDEMIIQQQRRMAGYSAAEEIAKAQELLKSGAISQEEFDRLKQVAMG